MTTQILHTLTLPAPAKLNLFLHILEQRSDGYHNLQTVFQLLDFGDELTITRTNTPEITIEPHIDGLPIHKNLIYKAAKLLQNHKKTRTILGARIKLTKKLPMGGGIGGGSSNAATTLLALNILWQTQLTIDELAELGRQLGADVPVFVRGHSAWAEGIGEQISPINLPEKWFLVLIPDCHVSTAQIFSHKELTRGTSPITVAAFLERGGKNDCQALVENIFPQVRDAVDWLSHYAHAQLTGTGACIFASFDSKRSAADVFARRPNNLRGFIAQGINMSTVHNSLP